MGRRGPAPTPTALKLASGNPGRRPINTREVVPPAGMPEAPDFLNELGKKYWDRLVPEMTACGLVRKIDAIALARYCDMLAQWVQIRRFLEQHGPTHAVRGEPGMNEKGEAVPGRVLGFRAYPQVSVCLRLQQQLITMEREFGLTPAARTRIHTAEEAGIKDGQSEGDIQKLRNKFLFPGAAARGA